MSGGLRIGESCAGNSYGRTTPSGTTYRIVKSLPSQADRGASLAEIPTDTRSNFEATTKAEESHGWRMQGGYLSAKSSQIPTSRCVYLLSKTDQSFDRPCPAQQGLEEFVPASQVTSFLEQIASLKAPEIDVEVDTASAGFLCSKLRRFYDGAWWIP